MSFCHQHQVAHRDLKLDNALLTDHDPPRLKLCDFGFAKRCGAGAVAARGRRLRLAFAARARGHATRRDTRVCLRLLMLVDRACALANVRMRTRDGTMALRPPPPERCSWLGASPNMDTMRIGTPEYMGPELISGRSELSRQMQTRPCRGTWPGAAGRPGGNAPGGGGPGLSLAARQVPGPPASRPIPPLLASTSPSSAPARGCLSTAGAATTARRWTCGRLACCCTSC